VGQRSTLVSGQKVSTGRALAPVCVLPTRAVERLVSVSSPGGFRIEGLTLDEAAKLLRALG
jgi:hypothetical protein